ncbi:MAG: DMT family transporter [Rhodospirillales bacterium]
MAAPAAATRASFVRGALWMLAAAFAFAVLLASVRYLSRTFSAFEIVLFRNVIGLAIAAPMIAGAGFAALRTRRFGGHVLRATLSYLAMVTNFWAMSYIAMSDTAALLFLIPLIALVVAALVLKERVDGPRWIAACIGFGGAMVIVRPGIATVDLPVIVMLCSAVLYAGAWISLKALAGTENAAVTVCYLNLLSLPLTLVPSLFVWVTPSWHHAPAILALGAAGWAAHYCQARSFAAADASAVMPIDFMRLPFSAVLGFALFGELSDAWTWVGAAIIFAASTYITRRESRLNAARR